MNQQEEIYDRLRRHLNNFPIGAPAHPALFKMLQLCFTPEEAEVAIKVPLTSDGFISAKGVASHIQRPVEETEEILMKMVRKGTLYVEEGDRPLLDFAGSGDSESSSREPGVKYFSLFSLEPGLWAGVWADGVMDERKVALRQAQEAYYREGFVHEIGSSNYPWTRIIPVEQKVDATSTVLQSEQIYNLIESWPHRIAVVPCACRVMERKCDKPLNTCIQFSKADFHVKYFRGRYISKEETYQTIQMAEDHGLVHLTSNFQSDCTFICNCCTCCCLILRGLVEFSNPRLFVKSNFVPSFSHDRCKVCMSCAKICPMNAISKALGKEEVDRGDLMVCFEDKCIGCGLCSHHCPEDAITMKRARNNISEQTAKDCWSKFSKERIY